MVSRLLNLVVPDSEDFFRRLPPETWPCTARMLPLSVRAPVLAGVAAVSSHPEYWVAKLVNAAPPSAQAGLMHCIRSVVLSRCRKGLPALEEVGLQLGGGGGEGEVGDAHAGSDQGAAAPAGRSG